MKGRATKAPQRPGRTSACGNDPVGAANWSSGSAPADPPTAKRPAHIGVISDTHGLLRKDAIASLRGCEVIIHAGDIGGREILDELARVAPVVAVRGNTDREPWAASLAEAAVVDAQGALIYVVHDVHSLDLIPAASGFHMVVSGHSHKPSNSLREGIMYLNPGSAGPRRFSLPITLARVNLNHNPWKIEFVQLEGTSVEK